MFLGILRKAMVLLCLMALGLPASLHAASWELEAIKGFPVYLVPKTQKNHRLKMLVPGERVLISPKKYGRWRKLLVTDSEGRAVKVWAHVEHMKGRARIRKLQKEETSKLVKELESELSQVQSKRIQKEQSHNLWYNSVGLGLSLHVSHLQWGKRTFQLSDETLWTVSEVTSTTYWPSLFVDLPAWSRSKVRFYIGYRTAEFEGESTADFIGTKQTSFSQTFLSLGLAYKDYFKKRKYWWGFGAEGAQGQKLTIAYDNTEIPVSNDDLPLFIIFYVAAGYDMRLTNHLFALGEIRLGTVYNQDPRIYFIEGALSLGWAL